MDSPSTGSAVRTRSGFASKLDLLSGLAVASPPTGLAVDSPPTGLAPDWSIGGPVPDWTHSLESMWSRPRLDSLSGLAVDSPPTLLALRTRCGLNPDWTRALD
jgi:hypothetical protein